MRFVRSSRPAEAPASGADWLALHRSGTMSAADQSAFQAWIDADPANQRAYEDARRAWRLAGELRDHPEMLALRETTLRTYPRPSHFLRTGIAAALVGAVLLSGWTAWQMAGIGTGSADRTASARSTFSTGVGQRSALVLSDGSRITLDTDSVVVASVSDEVRGFELLRGRARFRVAPDKHRPFVVSAGNNQVTATGTAFDVRFERERVEVALLEGTVRVDRAGQGRARTSARMMAGERLLVPDKGDWRRSALDPAKEAGWVIGRLSFDNQPLAAVVGELNRYSERKIVIADDRIARKPIVGVFKSGDVDEFVRLVRESGIAQVGTTSEQAVTLVAPSK